MVVLDLTVLKNQATVPIFKEVARRHQVTHNTEITLKMTMAMHAYENDNGYACIPDDQACTNKDASAKNREGVPCSSNPLQHKSLVLCRDLRVACSAPQVEHNKGTAGPIHNSIHTGSTSKMATYSRQHTAKDGTSNIEAALVTWG